MENFKATKFFPPFRKNLSHIIQRLIYHLICLPCRYTYPTDPSPISEEGKDRGRARTRMSSVCTDSSFSICSDFHGIRFVFAFATRCVVTACDDRHERVTACHLPNWQTLLSRSRGGECRPSSIVRIDIPPDSLVIGLRKFHWFRVWRLTIPIHVNKKKKKIK